MLIYDALILIYCANIFHNSSVYLFCVKYILEWNKHSVHRFCAFLPFVYYACQSLHFVHYIWPLEGFVLSYVLCITFLASLFLACPFLHFVHSMWPPVDLVSPYILCITFLTFVYLICPSLLVCITFGRL